MLIVLEGCDGSGKTTLATLLSQILNAEVIHCSTHTPNHFQFFLDIIEASKERDIIADRWCYGQFVYQKSTERPLANAYTDPDGHKTLQNLEVQMLNNAKIIFVTAPDEIIKERLADRSEKLINGLTVEEIQKRFRNLKDHSLLTWLEYNTGGEVNV